MAQLYPLKFIAAQGAHIENGQYTENFKGWTNELAHFDAKAWRRAYTRIEHDIKKDAQEARKAGRQVHWQLWLMRRRVLENAVLKRLIERRQWKILQKRGEIRSRQRAMQKLIIPIRLIIQRCMSD